jgi:pyruvate/2-oxoglutarate dehydrogenase complex dihydrolipoamide dehydrogenase (E3) component
MPAGLVRLLTPDLCVIGGGPAGLAAAAEAAAFGAPTVLVEKARLGGGIFAAMQLRALVAAARRMRAPIEGALTIETGPARVDFAAMMANVRAAAAAAEPNVSIERFTALGVTVLQGPARFIDRRTVAVGDTRIRARRFVIATGSRPALPPVQNLHAVPYLTTESVFDLKRLPGRLVVLGARPVGLALAQAFRRLGSEVIVLEPERALADEDAELAALLLETLRREGLDIRERTSIARVTRRGRSGVRVSIESGSGADSIDATHLLVASGGRPAIEELGLKEARIAFDERGIRVSRRLRTTNRRIYAIGDVSSVSHPGNPAEYQASLVVRSLLFRRSRRFSPELLPRVVFTDPELASVGMSEAAAAQRYRRICVLRWPLSENDLARAEGRTRGLVKLLTTRRGRILGAAILAEDADELVTPLVLTVRRRMNVRKLARSLPPLPGRAEVIRRAALMFDAQRLDSPWIRRLVQLLRKLG